MFLPFGRYIDGDPVKELTHVVAHQSQQLANKDEQIKLLCCSCSGQRKWARSYENVPAHFDRYWCIIGIIVNRIDKYFWLKPSFYRMEY